jgi:hypothetical protein
METRGMPSHISTTKATQTYVDYLTMTSSLARRAAEYQRLIRRAEALAEEQQAIGENPDPKALDEHIRKLRAHIAALTAHVAEIPSADPQD